MIGFSHAKGAEVNNRTQSVRHEKALKGHFF
jgi:hypothetical protein